MKRVFWGYQQLLCKTLLVLRKIQRRIIINIYWSSCTVFVILVRFEWNLNFRDFRLPSRSGWDLRSSGVLRSVWVPSWRVNWPLKMESIRCTEKSVKNYHCTLRNIPKQRIPESWISSIDIRKILQCQYNQKPMSDSGIVPW